MQLYRWDRCSYIVVITNEKFYLSFSYDYSLIESYIYFRVIVLVKSYVYYKFIKLQLLSLDFIFSRENLHLLDYIYYNLW